MTKQDLAAKVAEKTGMGHLQSVKAVEAVMETIVESVSDGASVFLPRFRHIQDGHPKGEEGPRHQQGRDHHAPGDEEAGVQTLQKTSSAESANKYHQSNPGFVWGCSKYQTL